MHLCSIYDKVCFSVFKPISSNGALLKMLLSIYNAITLKHALRLLKQETLKNQKQCNSLPYQMSYFAPQHNTFVSSCVYKVNN